MNKENIPVVEVKLSTGVIINLYAFLSFSEIRGLEKSITKKVSLNMTNRSSTELNAEAILEAQDEAVKITVKNCVMLDGRVESDIGKIRELINDSSYPDGMLVYNAIDKVLSDCRSPEEDKKKL